MEPDPLRPFHKGQVFYRYSHTQNQMRRVEVLSVAYTSRFGELTTTMSVHSAQWTGSVWLLGGRPQTMHGTELMPDVGWYSTVAEALEHQERLLRRAAFALQKQLDANSHSLEVLQGVGETLGIIYETDGVRQSADRRLTLREQPCP